MKAEQFALMNVLAKPMYHNGKEEFCIVFGASKLLRCKGTHFTFHSSVFNIQIPSEYLSPMQKSVLKQKTSG